MFIISAGMQKSGSAYIYNLINDLLISSGYNDARDIKQKHSLEKVMQWRNNNIGELTTPILLKLLLLSKKTGKFAVKTHAEPTKFHNFLIKLGLIKTIYIYRDPRDVLLSAQDHGKKIIANGENHTFANCVEFNSALENVKTWVNIFKSYKKVNNVYTVSYEELLTNPTNVMEDICNYLGVKISKKNIQNILTKYNKDNKNAEMKGLHFNKAKIQRYKEELTQEQKKVFKNEMGDVIVEMGYHP